MCKLLHGRKKEQLHHALKEKFASVKDDNGLGYDGFNGENVH
jgi:hypothetical protein